MSVEFDRESPGKFDSRTLNRKTLNRWTGRNDCNDNEGTGLDLLDKGKVGARMRHVSNII